MEKRNLTCIVCPIGCSIEVSFDLSEDKIETISGYKCKRGKEYAYEECFHPSRTLTSTVAAVGLHMMVPVKSDKPVPKDMMFACMELINQYKLNKPVKIGDIVIENILDTGINIIATSNAG